MRDRSVGGAGRQAAVALACAALAAGCARERPRSAAAGLHLVERNDYQALYDAKGRIVRLLQDANHDGVADAQVLYWPNGTPKAGEIDTDLDGRIDRWEAFDTGGKLSRVGRDTNGDGSADASDEIR